jgi:hypothetical protein
MAASRYAVPLHFSNSVSTTSPFRFSIIVAAIRQLRFMAPTLARQARVGVRSGFVGVVASLLAVEVHCRVSTIIWRRCRLTIAHSCTLGHKHISHCADLARVADAFATCQTHNFPSNRARRSWMQLLERQKH